jgi:hypothetical protein
VVELEFAFIYAMMDCDHYTKENVSLHAKNWPWPIHSLSLKGMNLHQPVKWDNCDGYSLNGSFTWTAGPSRLMWDFNVLLLNLHSCRFD